MSIALADNHDHIHQLCGRLSIGVPELSVSPVQGGFHHRMWRLRTHAGIYAVKQLSADTDIANPLVIEHFNLTERVAGAFRDCGIQAISALPWQGDYLQLIGSSAYLVYPWSEAKGLAVSQLSETHALQVAEILALMHRSNIDVPGMERQGIDMHPEDKITAVIRRAGDLHIRYAAELEKALPEFLQIARRYTAAIPVLDQHRVISHGDLDQKNVLWDGAGKPLVIDWESARLLNPTYELLQTALEWSGISRQFDPSLFVAILKAYQQAGNVIERKFVEPALHCIMGDWLNWLMYVVDRAANTSNPAKRKRGTDQFDLVFPTLIRLQQLFPALLAMPVLNLSGSKK